MTLPPFHPDELEAQARAGKGATGAGVRAFMPDQHREFFALLPYLFVATTDREGWPLATMLTGAPGFVHSPDPTTLRVDALPAAHDPAADAFGEGQELGILGIEIRVERVSAKFKYGGNVDGAHRRAVAERLLARGMYEDGAAAEHTLRRLESDD